MAILYENQNNRKEITQKPQNTENTTKSPKNFYKDPMDKSNYLMYNNGNKCKIIPNTHVPVTLLLHNWKNKDYVKYAGDGAKKSIEAGLKEALDFMKVQGLKMCKTHLLNENLQKILTTRTWQ